VSVTPHEFDDISAESMLTARSFKWSELGGGLLGAGAAEMDFGTAPPVAAALREAIDTRTFGYLTPALAAEAQAACAQWQEDAYGWLVAADDVHLLPDVIRALHLSIDHFSRPGSAVVVPTPAYPPFLRVPATLGRRVVELPLVRDGQRYRYDLDLLDQALASGARLLLLCNPHNPSGQVLDAAELAAIGAVVERQGARVFSDEVHAPLVYPGRRHVPYASVSAVAAGHAITATSASKAWNLAGLKCAQMIVSNDQDRERWDRLNRLATDGTSTLGAVAAVAAYRRGQPWLRAVIDYLDRNRRLLTDLLHERLPEARYTQPEGTFLAWLDCRQLPTGDCAPAEHFAVRARVSTVDGADCGRAGEGFVRVNFATSRVVLTSIVTRLAHSVVSDPSRA
jgi:cysteine-S-conjugate beta-lyase